MDDVCDECATETEKETRLTECKRCAAEAMEEMAV